MVKPQQNHDMGLGIYLGTVHTMFIIHSTKKDVVIFSILNLYYFMIYEWSFLPSSISICHDLQVAIVFTAHIIIVGNVLAVLVRYYAQSTHMKEETKFH